METMPAPVKTARCLKRVCGKKHKTHLPDCYEWVEVAWLEKDR